MAEPSEALLKMTARRMVTFIAEHHPTSPRRVRLDYLTLLDRNEFAMAMRKHIAEVHFFGDAIEVMSEDSPTGERLADLLVEAFDEMGLEKLLLGTDPDGT